MTAPDSEGARLIHQGDVYWVQLAGADDAAPRILHPHVVVQDDLLNHSRLDTVVVCTLTSNLKRAAMPGNVLLAPGEANLPRQSVVEVTKLFAVDKAQLGEYIGALSVERLAQIFAGMRFVQRSFFTR